MFVVTPLGVWCGIWAVLAGRVHSLGKRGTMDEVRSAEISE